MLPLHEMPMEQGDLCIFTHRICTAVCDAATHSGEPEFHASQHPMSFAGLRQGPPRIGSNLRNCRAMYPRAPLLYPENLWKAHPASPEAEGASCRVSETKVESVSSDCMVVVTQQLDGKFSFAVPPASSSHFVRYERLPAGRPGKPVGKFSVDPK